MSLEDLEVRSYLLKRDENKPVTLERVMSPTGDRWAVRKLGFCLDRLGLWILEPSPSERDEPFYNRCRFETAEAALEVYNKFQVNV